MLNEFLDLERWAQWFAALDREFIFLLALPFVVAIVGLWSAFAEDEARESQAAEPRALRERRRGERRRSAGRVAPHGSH
jgi:hypothetical protein